jgi:hypothetical protein
MKLLHRSPEIWSAPRMGPARPMPETETKEQDAGDDVGRAEKDENEEEKSDLCFGGVAFVGGGTCAARRAAARQLTKFFAEEMGPVAVLHVRSEAPDEWEAERPTRCRQRDREFEERVAAAAVRTGRAGVPAIVVLEEAVELVWVPSSDHCQSDQQQQQQQGRRTMLRHALDLAASRAIPVRFVLTAASLPQPPCDPVPFFMDVVHWCRPERKKEEEPRLAPPPSPSPPPIFPSGDRTEPRTGGGGVTTGSWIPFPAVSTWAWAQQTWPS